MLSTRRYNAFGQLASLWKDATLLNYTYRPDKLRHSTTVRASANPAITTLHHWDGQNMILETENGRIKGKYVRGANLIAQVIDLSLFYYLLNAHGDVIRRVGANGEATPQYKYDAFGNQRDEVDTDPNPFRYCGEYWDRHAEEIYLRARTYNPQNGRFSQEDMARSGSNWYGYCANNPIYFVDPSGYAAMPGGGKPVLQPPAQRMPGVSRLEQTQSSSSFDTTANSNAFSAMASSAKNTFGSGFNGTDLSTLFEQEDVNRPYSGGGVPIADGYGFDPNGNKYYYSYELNPEDSNKYTVTVIVNYGTDYEITITYGIWGGQVHFDFTENDSEAILMYGLDALATTMLVVAKEINPQYLNGRTVSGVVVEIWMHYTLYTLGFDRDKSNPVDIGGLSTDMDGYDYNGMHWEVFSSLRYNPWMPPFERTK